MFTNIHMVAVPFIKRGVGRFGSKPTLKRNLKVAATWKTAAPKGPLLPGEVPDEA